MGAIIEPIDRADVGNMYKNKKKPNDNKDKR